MQVFRRSIFTKNNYIFHLNERCQSTKISSSQSVIGPVDPVSNLRPIKYVADDKETEAERKLRGHHEELQLFNQLFWSTHNKSFIEEKRKFECNLLREKSSDNQIISADEMSVFYERFLNENWKNHLNYLLTWYKKNIIVTLLQSKVALINLHRKSINRWK